MLLLLVFVSLTLFCSGYGQVDFLPGSCARAGFTGCCTNDSCAGEPASCFCDVSCYTYDDCCSDMEILCPLPQEVNLPHQPLYPMAMEVTFHTARIYWTIQANCTNETYSVQYYTEGTEKRATVHLSANNSCNDDPSLLNPCLMLTSLKAGMHYHYIVVATNTVGAQESKEASFTTLEYVTVQRVRAEVLNETAVRVSWMPPWVPEVVALLQYFVYSDSQGSIPMLHRVFSSHATTGEIAGLDSEKVYMFWVVAHIQDADGSVIDSRPSLVAPESTVFVPATALIQLRGEPFSTCDLWNARTETDITEAFRSALLHALGNACGCSYAEAGITGEHLLCVRPATAVYRAAIASTVDYTALQLVDFLESWLATAPELQMADSTVSLNEKCSVRIALKSEAVCQTEVETQDPKPCDCDATSKPPSSVVDEEAESSNDSETCVAIGVLIVSLVAEFLLILVLLMAGVVMYLCWTRRGRKTADLDHVLPAVDTHSEPNIYVHHLDPAAAIGSTTADTEESSNHT